MYLYRFIRLRRLRPTAAAELLGVVAGYMTGANIFAAAVNRRMLNALYIKRMLSDAASGPDEDAIRGTSGRFDCYRTEEVLTSCGRKQTKTMRTPIKTGQLFTDVLSVKTQPSQLCVFFFISRQFMVVGRLSHVFF